MSLIDQTKKAVDIADAAESVKDAGDAVVSTVDVASTEVSSSIATKEQIEKGVNAFNKLGEIYESFDRRKAGNVMDRFVGGIAALFSGVKKIAKDVEDGGGPKILP